MRAIFILLIFVILILSSCTSVEVAKQITKATNSIKTSIQMINADEEKLEAKISNEEKLEENIIIEKKEIYSLSLATNILRAETAAIAAVTIVNYHLNFS